MMKLVYGPPHIRLLIVYKQLLEEWKHDIIGMQKDIPMQLKYFIRHFKIPTVIYCKMLLNVRCC